MFEPKKEYSYEIGGRKYFQRPLVLGQLRQLANLILKDIVLPENIELTPQFILTELGDKVALALAIILNPEGILPENKVLEEWEKVIEFNIEIETALQVVEDFFDCTQIFSLPKKLQETIGRVVSKQATLSEKTGSEE